MIITNIKKLISHKTNTSRSLPVLYNNLSLKTSNGKIVKLDTNFKLNRIKNEEIIDAKNKAVIPGLVECHTHTVFGGDRIDDFERRSRGLTYMDILKAGGGINHTVKCTRESRDSELIKTGLERVRKFIENGITTLEIKSGYGLNVKDELRLLKIIGRIKEESGIDIIPTFLGAHTFPPEYRENRDKYVDIITDTMLPLVRKNRLSGFCDIFCEEGAFTISQTEKILKAAKKLGFRLKIHADQLTNSGASLLAAKYRCISADHLDKIDSTSIQALKKSGTTAVLLPYATLFTGHKEYAPARDMLDSGLRVAISTDFNPGSSYTFNLFFCATLGITQMKMTVEEALMAITINAAYALGLERKKGTIETGKEADLIILNTDDYREIFYNPDPALINTVISKGRIVYKNPK